MTYIREHWQGVSLPGNYTLDRWMGGDDRAAFFETPPAPDGSRAVVKLVPEPVANDGGPLDLWLRTRQLRHPNLIELLDCGRIQHHGENAIYAVFEAPDETLAAALDRAPLDPHEARAVLTSALDALRYLHAQGLVIGALDPDHVVAVGDRVKLSTSALREAETSSAYRHDVRLLGELWQHALAEASPISSVVAAHAADPNPQARWTLAEINAALDASPPVVAPPAPPPPTLPEPSAAGPSDAAPPVAPAPTHPAPIEDLPLALPPSSHRRFREPVAPFRFPKWIFAGVAGLLLLILALNRSNTARVSTPSPVAPVSLPSETLAPSPVPHPAASPVPSVSRPSPLEPGKIWRVIAFTYRVREPAAAKAKQLNQHHPGLNAAVFSPKGRKGYYLVSLGGRMTHDDAVRLQRSARGKGLPRDLYVQNYSD